MPTIRSTRDPRRAKLELPSVLGRECLPYEAPEIPDELKLELPSVSCWSNQRKARAPESDLCAPCVCTWREPPCASVRQSASQAAIKVAQLHSCFRVAHTHLPGRLDRVVSAGRLCCVAPALCIGVRESSVS